MKIPANRFTLAIALAGELPRGWDYWERYDRAMLEACDELWVLCLDGWEDSKGIKGEIAIMQEMGKPVHYVFKGATGWEMI